MATGTRTSTPCRTSLRLNSSTAPCALVVVARCSTRACRSESPAWLACTKGAKYAPFDPAQSWIVDPGHVSEEIEEPLKVPRDEQRDVAAHGVRRRAVQRGPPRSSWRGRMGPRGSTELRVARFRRQGSFSGRAAATLVPAPLQQPLEGGHELVDVLEVAVDRSEADEGHLVQLAQALHQELAHLVGGHFAVGPFVDHRLHAVHDQLQGLHRHRPLLAGLEQPGQDLLAVEALAAAVLLHHQVRDLIDSLVRGEALAAAKALAPAANDLAFLAFPGVHNLVFEVRAEGALHVPTSYGCPSVIRATVPMVSPSRPSSARPKRSTGTLVRACAAMPAAAAIPLGTAKASVRQRR